MQFVLYYGLKNYFAYNAYFIATLFLHGSQHECYNKVAV